MDKVIKFPDRGQNVALTGPVTTSNNLSGGGGDGTFDGMEARIAALEANVANLKGDTGRIEAKLDRIDSSVAKLASKGDLLGYLIAISTVALTMVGIIIGGLAWLETYTADLHAPPAPVPPPMPKVTKREPPPKLTDAERHARFKATAQEVEASENQSDFDRAFSEVAINLPTSPEILTE